MDQTLLILAQMFLVMVVIGVVCCLYYGLNYCWSSIGVEQERRQLLLRYIVLGVLLWLTFLAALVRIRFFENFSSMPPRITVAVLPPLILIVYLMFSKSFAQKVLQFIPPKWLVLVQSFRIAVELILWMGLLGGFVPYQMTFEGFNYDIIVGITALLAGTAFFLRGRYRKFEVFIWNVSGLALLINIVAISFLSAPSPFRVFMNEPANTFIAYFPFIWIPGFLVPFALAMHLFSIKQIFLRPRLTSSSKKLI
ncbi:MAG: hypothetical protein AAFO94_03890 [Bacteroidota bacterium]